MRRNTPSVDVEEISTVCIVANNLSSQEYKHAVNLLIEKILPFKFNHPIATFLESLSLAKEKIQSIYKCQGFLF